MNLLQGRTRCTATIRRVLASLTVLGAITMLSACANDANRYLGGDETRMTDAPPEQQWQNALQRPDIEQVTARYEEALSAIERRITKEFQLPPWAPSAELTTSSCGDYPAISAADTEARSLAVRSSPGVIPENGWDRAQRIAQEIIARYEFGLFQPEVDRAGDHSVIATDKLGGSISFGTKKATVLSANTGCHLTAEAHKRASRSARYG